MSDQVQGPSAVAPAKETPRPANPALNKPPRMFAEDELFYRDLSEVHLLMDFISGRADKSLGGLKGACAHTDSAGQVIDMSAQDIVADVCKISYPPDGSRDAQAGQAAFLLFVKDRLNYLAAPARGLTIAFTSMFSGVSLHYPRAFQRRPKVGGAAPKAGQPRQGADGAPASFYSAQAAYPYLEERARSFRAFYMRLPIEAGAIIALITLFNLDITVTGSVVQKITSAQSDYVKLFAAERGFAPTAAACVKARAEAAGAAPTSESSSSVAACAAADAAVAQEKSGRQSLARLMNRYALFSPVNLTVKLFGALQPDGGAGLRQAPVSAHDGVIQAWQPETFTLAVLGGLNTILIPTAFGWLGTLAGLMRSITAKMRDSILAPRDHQAGRIAGILGMTSGLAVGLFFNAADPGSLAKGVGGTITLSAASLSFLAGFGAEAFFTFLDGVLVRLMPATGSAPSPSPSAAPPK
ncbi:MAG: hypothetical protein JOZ27_04015 [Caulobacteraceae bacterium]|nr:hypothetical protein [Caulobacteraceae bacterium]